MHRSSGSGRRAQLVEHARHGGVVGLVEQAVDPEPTAAQGDTIFAGGARVVGRLGVGMAVGD